MDETDRKLLVALVGAGRSTWQALGSQVSLSAPSVHERIHKLEDQEVILGYSAQLAPAAVGAETAAVVALRFPGSSADRERLEAGLLAEPAVLELHEVAGDDCYLAKVRVGSPRELAQLLARLRDSYPALTSRSSVVLRTVFERPLLWPSDRPPPVA